MARVRSLDGLSLRSHRIGRERPSSAAWGSVALGIVAVATSSIPYLRRPSGMLFGDVGDARWSIALHEHWYLLLTGRTRLRETLFFFPHEYSLAYSDAFLFPGAFLYTPLRLGGLDAPTAWRATFFLGLLTLNLGLALVARRTLRSLTFQSTFVLIGGTGYALVTQLNHPQSLGYGLVFLVAYFAVRGYQRSGRNWEWAVVPGLGALLALTSWYAFVFLALLSTAALGFALLLDDGSGRARVRARVRAIGPVLLGVGGFVGVAGLMLWAAIYLPVASLSDERPWGEYLTYAPLLSDLVNVSIGDGFWARRFESLSIRYDRLPSERPGVTPLLLVASLVATTHRLRGFLVRRDEHGRAEVVIMLTVLSVWLLFLADGYGHSLYRLLWEFVPGASSIRVPLRVNILVHAALTWIVLRSIDRSANRRNVFAIAVGFLIALAIFVEQHRAPSARWTPDQFLPQGGDHIVTMLRTSACDAFVLAQTPHSSATPSWVHSIDAVSIAIASGIPTVNGYSGLLPPAFPYESSAGESVSDEHVARLLSWASSEAGTQGPGPEICIVRADSIEIFSRD